MLLLSPYTDFFFFSTMKYNCNTAQQLILFWICNPPLEISRLNFQSLNRGKIKSIIIVLTAIKNKIHIFIYLKINKKKKSNRRSRRVLAGAYPETFKRLP